MAEDSGIVGEGVVGEMIVGGTPPVASVEDYANLVTSEHVVQPNFMASLAALTRGFVEDNNALRLYPAQFDLDVAVGAQLDVVGQWVGLSRRLRVPVSGVYFAFDTVGVGFDEGVWMGPFDPSTGLVSLDDETYRLMLYAKIAANTWDGSLGAAERILAEIFVSSPGTLVFIQDNFDMTMTIGLAGAIPSALFVALLAQEYIPLRPAAVGSSVVVTSVDGDPLFGFDVENDYISGFDTGAWGVSP